MGTRTDIDRIESDAAFYLERQERAMRHEQPDLGWEDFFDEAPPCVPASLRGQRQVIDCGDPDQRGTGFDTRCFEADAHADEWAAHRLGAA